jgi:exopolysaccharide biosynthesis WecB/TagA/CpsF family protein
MSVRVLHVVGGGDTGGAQAYLLSLVRALRDQNCDARLLCLGTGGLATEAARRGLPVEVLPMANAWDPRVLPGLCRRIITGSWDVVHTHGMRANFAVRVLMRAMRRRPLLFTTIHSDLALDYSSTLRSRTYSLLDRSTIGTVDALCCVSADLAAKAEARGIPRSKIHVVHPGLELPEPPSDRSGGPPTEAVRPPGSRPVIGTIARLVPVKDLGLLLEAARRVLEVVPGLRVVIVGDGPERSSLERKAAKEGLSEVVEFRGEVRPAWPALRELDVYVSTSVAEGLPLSVLEAMSAGLPVVATAVGGLPEAIEDGVNGFLIRRNADRAATAAALAQRLATILTDEALGKRMSSEARRRVAEGFSTGAVGERMLSLYQGELASRRGPVAAERRAEGSATPWPSVCVLGFRVDLVTLEQAAQQILTAATDTRPSRKAGRDPGRAFIAVSFNPELVMRAQKDPAAAAALADADLCYPDGVGAVWAASRQGALVELSAAGKAEPQRVAGIDLAQRVLELAAEHALPVYFLGAAEGVAAEAARCQRERLPGLSVAGCRNGFFSPSDEDDVVAAVRDSGARILLVGMGAPRQELLLHARRNDLGAAVALGIGGSFDVWAGKVKRAPAWAQRAEVEWLYRLAQDPRRFRRQLVLARFVARVVRGRSRRGDCPPEQLAP